jgi:hypothetical protein
MADPNDTPSSPFPIASTARVLDPHQGKVGATLVARMLAHLAVKVTFHLQPCYGLEVKFYEAKPDGSKAKQLGGPLRTDRMGVARLDHLIEVGLYVCEIQDQAKPVVVPTVQDPEKPHVVPTPVDRPYFDFDEDPEFDHEPREANDYEGAGEGEAVGADDETRYAAVIASKHDAGELLADHKIFEFESGPPSDVKWTS